MNNWHSFLHQQGASFLGEETISFGEHPRDFPALLGQTTITPLIHMGLLSISGSDSARFLQGQITCDVQQLDTHHNQYGARCNPKGRMLTNFILCQLDENQLVMLMNRSLVQPSVGELSKFAAFFKTELVNNTDQYQCIGVSGPNAETLASSVSATHKHSYSDGRQLLVVPTETAQAAWEQLASAATPTGTELWLLEDIRAGLGLLQAETSTMFIPQMLNLQAIGGISFKKGCYTGQEVVARMKYLGKLKRRMYRLTTKTMALPTPGTPCYLADQKQSIGNIVQAANADGGHMEILVVLTDEASSSDTLIIGEGQPKAVEKQSMPYELDQ